MSNKRLNLVVAVCTNNGIGINGQLPWRIKGDMAFFKRITSEREDQDKKNAVIMGRKTWDSIPQKFRPLANRINVVISRNMQQESVPSNVHVTKSLDNALEILSHPPLCDSVENIFVIGGSSIYKMAMESQYCHRLYITRVQESYECDTFLPEFDMSLFKQIRDPNIDSEIKEENGIQYKFEIYEKIYPQNNSFYVMAAMLYPSRGIGKNGTIAWPPIRQDYMYYLDKTTSTSDPSKKNAIIKGRVTWEETGMEEKSNPKIVNIVISETMREKPEFCHYIAKNLDDALSIAKGIKSVENVWVMGGKSIYAKALKRVNCQKVFLTKIFAEHDADRFLPAFEKDYIMLNDGSQVLEENGVKFKFEVFQRKDI